MAESRMEQAVESRFSEELCRIDPIQSTHRVIYSIDARSGILGGRGGETTDDTVIKMSYTSAVRGDG